MDGNSFVWKDTCSARYAVVIPDAVIKNTTTASWEFQLGKKSVKYGQKNSKITKSCMGS
jgi:hypothetical protein